MQCSLHCRSTVMMKEESTWCENLLYRTEEPWSHWCTDGPRSKNKREFQGVICRQGRGKTSTCILGYSIMAVSHLPSIQILVAILSEPAVVQVAAAISQGSHSETPNTTVLFIVTSSKLFSFTSERSQQRRRGKWLLGITTQEKFDKRAVSWCQASKLCTHLLPWWVTHNTKLWKSMRAGEEEEGSVVRGKQNSDMARRLEREREDNTNTVFIFTLGERKTPRGRK